MYILVSVLILLSVTVFAQKNESKKQIATTDKKEETSKENKLQEAINGLKFRSIGPALTSGRIADFAVHPENIHHYYVATASGGVWRTTNGGASYEPIFDQQGSYSIGCIALAPSNPNIVWVGTGENHNQRSVGYGDGVYKSEDGGNTWTNMGLKNSEHIAKIIIHPKNPDIVFVAAYGPLWSAGGERGVYKTTDGGKTWKQVLHISENTGVSDLAMDPSNPDVLYACAHQRRRHVFTLIDGGPESALYKTKNGGETWEKLTNGLPTGDIGRIAIAVSPVNPMYVYLQIEAEQDKGGVFRSTNGGASFEKMSSYYTSGNYFQEIFCDPIELNRIYAMDVLLHVSNDGGRTWIPLGERFKHGDNHAMWINPKNNNHYLVGSDGGVYESFDKGKTWLFKPNLPVTQFYRVGVDNSLPFYFIYGGTQDNFSMGGPSRTLSINGITNSDWFFTHGGDGFVSRIDPDDPNIVYAESQYGGLVRYDRRSGEEVPIQPIEGKGEKALRWNWDSPLIISPHKSTRLYFAANKVFRSEDRGNSWTCISEDLTQQIDRNKLPVMGKVWSIDAVAKSQSTSFYGNIVCLQESPKKENLLYVGTDDGLIQVSEDARTWRKIDNFPGIPKNTYVSAILASQHDENVVYAAFDNHKNGDFKPYLLKSTDKGKTWTSIVGNLPERGSVYCIAEDHINKDLLFVGTEFGVFVTLNGGKQWIQMKNGLPTIAVRDIAIQKRENDLVLATFGRGFYILDDYSPLRTLSEELLNKEAHLFTVKNALLYVPARPLMLKEKGFLGESYYTAP
ncbi:MAG: glycosyl hydrolase, partial [Bacteroidia bacterium]|nr:glycosyl hydrolase [Bacteroidia bacterium]